MATPISAAVSKRLASVSRQIRQHVVMREEASEASRASELSPKECQEALARLLVTKQFAQRRMLAAVEVCDVATAERELQVLLSCAAREKGLRAGPQLQLSLG